MFISSSQMLSEKKSGDIRLVEAHILQLWPLVRNDSPRRRAKLVEHVIYRGTDDDSVACSDAGRIGRVDNVVDEVVHLFGLEIHETVDLGLRGDAVVGGEGFGVAAKDHAEPLSDVGYHSVRARMLGR